MYRHDYILRLIEQFGRSLLLLRNRILRREAEKQTVTAEIGDMARQAGLDLDVARTLDVPSLLMWLAPGGQVDQARLWLMAELLYLEGLQGLEGDGGSARADFTRAAAILDRLEPNWRPSPDLPSATELAAEVRTHLSAPS